MTLFELQDKRRNLLSELSTICDKTGVTDAELRRGRAIKSEVQQCDDEIDLIVARDNIQHTGKQPVTEPGGYRVTVENGGMTPEGGPKGQPRGRSYRHIFGEATPAARDGFESLSEYFEAVTSGRRDDRLKDTRSMSGKVPSDGGFLLPEQYSQMLLDGALEGEIVRPRASVWGMTSDTLQAPAWDDTDHSGGETHGGVAAAWTAQSATITESNPKLRRISLTAKKLALLSAAPNELVMDAPNFESQMGNALTGAAAWNLDDAFLNGDGSGKPLGVLNAPSLVTVGAEGGQVADTIIYENLTKMFSRLHPACIGNSVWVVNPSTIPQLLTLSVTIGTSGSHIPVLSQQGGNFTMLTRPVIFTEKVPALGNSGDVLLADFSKYVIGLRKEITMEQSQHVGFKEDETYFRVTLRADGQPAWSEAFTPKNGSSLSWAVVLEDR